MQTQKVMEIVKGLTPKPVTKTVEVLRVYGAEPKDIYFRISYLIIIEIKNEWVDEYIEAFSEGFSGVINAHICFWKEGTSFTELHFNITVREKIDA